ncbi:unnamed protein product [Prorocentrum cordatum]|uniref:ATP-dependent DNA helicase n=1 Tax=Prorocentrum cordatum TaxID=2364126 RepID=A0ABN9WKU5_9DINO|nr:unnamed protein product [Polarella glacialis]
MPPKKTEAALLADVAEHRRWATANLTALRARGGIGLKAKLQQRAGLEEQRIYKWYVKHAGVASDHPTVAASLSELDALVNDSLGPAASACPDDAPPAKQRRLTERGGEAAACAAPLQGESRPGQSTPAARGVAPTACSAGHGPAAAAAAKASPASTPPIGIEETPAKRPRLFADGLGATPAQTTGGLTPATAEALARSCRKSPWESPLVDDSVRLARPGNPARGASRPVERPRLRPREEERLLAAVPRKAVKDLYVHVRDEALRLGNGEYLPQWRENKPKYRQLNYVWNLHQHGELQAAEYALLAHQPHIIGPELFGAVEKVECPAAVIPSSSSAWRWTFKPAGVDVEGPQVESRADAARALAGLQARLYPEWHHPGTREQHLRALLRDDDRQQQMRGLLAQPGMRFARAAVLGAAASAPRDGRAGAAGFPDLTNTCYINAVVQCLYHTHPFRADIEGMQPGASNMGDRLRDLFCARSSPASTAGDIRPPLVALVRQILQQPPGFESGRQQDAAECLMRVLEHADLGGVRRRVCGDGAAASVEGMVHCCAAEEAQVGRDAPPVPMAAMIQASLTGEQAVREASEAVVLRVESMYEQDGRQLRILNGDAVSYEVAAFAQHRAARGVPPLQRMRGGHYVAYVNKGGRWFELDDAVVTELPEPPDAHPYLVFLARARPRRSIPMGGKRRDPRGPDDALEAAARLSRVMPAASGGAAAGLASGSGSGSRGLPQAAGSAAGRGRTGRDWSGRDQSGRDETGKDQTGRNRSGQPRGIAGVHPAARAVWNASAAADNRDHTRADPENSADNPFKRYVDNWDLRRTSADVKCRTWSQRAEPSGPQPCRLCQGRDFAFREDWKKHVDDEHGGVQRYRNALFSSLSLKPYVVKGEEWRAIVANYAEFYARAAVDWEKPTERMRELAQTPEGLSADERWAPRTRCACVFCARLHWSEDLSLEFLAGKDCFMKNPEAVAKLLSWEVYHKHWPDIPEAELRASAVRLRIGNTDTFQLVLMHKRRVTDAQALGDERAPVCEDCLCAFSPRHPRMCKFTFANHLWLGRNDPLFRNANLSHQMLLALARVVTTKVVLRPESYDKQRSGDGPTWDFLFHQTGMVGSAILFGNASCKEAMERFPPASIKDAFAVTFLAAKQDAAKEQPPDGSENAAGQRRREGLAGDAAGQQDAARRAVRGIARLKVNRAEFDSQAQALQSTNVVYKDKDYHEALVAQWCPNPLIPEVPPVVLDSVVAVPLEDSPGAVVAAGPADATAAGAQDMEDADVQACKESRYVSAFSEEDIPGAAASAGALEVTALIKQLEELDATAQRSVAKETEHAIESGSALLDEAGRERVLQLCESVRNRAARLSRPERELRLQEDLARAALGEPVRPRQAGGAEATMANLEVTRGTAPLSLFDWKVRTQARPSLWRYGDAGHLDPKRTGTYPQLLAHEWITRLCMREEMEYTLDTDEEKPYRVRENDDDPEVNRFAADWVSLHMFATLHFLTERHQSAFAFLKNGGMKWAEKVQHLTPDALAAAARAHAGGGGVAALASNANVPNVVRDALNIMQMAVADVVGTDGHRRLCRHEGVAYMALFGCPLIFATPNVADTKQPLFVRVEGQEIPLDDRSIPGLRSDVIPKYRDMMRRVAQDPVGQTVCFELIMRLFFIHVLGVRPECVGGRRRGVPPRKRCSWDWCTDGVAASSTAPGIFGPVQAFRGEIEAQGRGSLHPHILVWLCALSTRQLVHVLRRHPAAFRERLGKWMRACVMAVESTCQSSVEVLPRRFGHVDQRVDPLPFSVIERDQSRFDGGSELDALREEKQAGAELTEDQETFLETEDRDSWLRPDLPLRDATGRELAPGEKAPPRPSSYGMPIGAFAVGKCPAHRRRGLVQQDTGAGEPAARGVVPTVCSDAPAAQDVRELAKETMTHVCGESCYKYSGNKTTKICRHGFYYIVTLADWRRRRRGKPLRNAMFAVRSSTHGMQGRLLHFQLHPSECITNYAGAAAGRFNLDAQDLRRVSDPKARLDEGEVLPHVGSQPKLGYMGTCELGDADAYVNRPEVPEKPLAWTDDCSPEEWRDIMLQCQTEDAEGEDADDVDAADTFADQLELDAQAAFSDGLNTGFYINSYTTKQCPSMEGVLVEMRRGLERLQAQRQAQQDKMKLELQQRGDDPEKTLSAADRRALGGKSKFGETLDLVKNLSASYRRCYWKSGPEMLFPIFYGHLTYAPHRCWAIFIKKGVFLAAGAWRREHGRSLRHKAKQDGGRAPVQYLGRGVDPYTLEGWREEKDDDGQAVYVSPEGQRFPDILTAYEHDVATKAARDAPDHRQVVSFLAKFMQDMGCESEEAPKTGDGFRIVRTTSTLDDWLHRGDDPVLKHMSLQVYAMWVYRCEKPDGLWRDKTRAQHLDFDFAPHYALYATHKQRLAPELRAPLFEGFTMPTMNKDCETACLYKQLLLRPLEVENSETPEDERMLRAFAPLMEAPGAPRDMNVRGSTCFARSWAHYEAQADAEARAAAARFLARHEWPSIWETQEVQEEFFALHQARAEGKDAEGDSLDPAHCPDREKPRATVHQYVSMIAMQVAPNLEGIALAREEKKPRQYQSDAAVQSAYLKATTGGGAGQDEGAEAGEGVEHPGAPPKRVGAHFQPVPTRGIDGEQDMADVLNFAHRKRLTRLAKELLALPCMSEAAREGAGAPEPTEAATAPAPAAGYRPLVTAAREERHAWGNLHDERLQDNRDEEDAGAPDGEDAGAGGLGGDPAAASFASSVYSTPSAYIAALVAGLPENERLTRDQTLFVAKFAKACDDAWEDDVQKKPWSERKVTHLLLLGQGGSGKTHVVQKIVFPVVEYLWPSSAQDKGAMMVVAFSNAQAKNISTETVKARTLHNACALRVQKYINAKMRPGSMQKRLQWLWEHVRVLVIEEVSMVAAALYNALDLRACHGRSDTHDVQESTYKRPHHHFGRVPIVLHLGDFLQLKPTGSIGLLTDVNELLDDGSYKYAEPPTVEIQHAIRVFSQIPCVFELKGTKRFEPGDPLIAFLGCMREGKRFPPEVWSAWEKTLASDNHGVLDPRHQHENFRLGYGMGIYWETLARWINTRARRDARRLGVPLVFLQAVDECGTIQGEPDAGRRLLNVPNMHKTGDIHGVLPARVGMEVRFTAVQEELKKKLGLVQEQRATIVSFEFHADDERDYEECAPGQLFRPCFLPQGIWLHVHGFQESPIYKEVAEVLLQGTEGADDDGGPRRGRGACSCSGPASRRSRGRARGRTLCAARDSR